jgi:hypothetical protein
MTYTCMEIGKISVEGQPRPKTRKPKVIPAIQEA